MYKMSKNPVHPIEVQDYLQRAGNSVNASTTFLANLRRTHNKFPEYCSSDPKYTERAISAISVLIDEASNLLKALGRSFDLTEIKKKNIKYTTQIVVSTLTYIIVQQVL